MVGLLVGRIDGWKVGRADGETVGVVGLPKKLGNVEAKKSTHLQYTIESMLPKPYLNVSPALLGSAVGPCVGPFEGFSEG